MNEKNTESFIYPTDKNFIFVDVETANWSNDRICAIGMIIVKSGKTTGYYSLIDPKTRITFTYIHGITRSDCSERFNGVKSLSRRVLFPHCPLQRW